MARLSESLKLLAAVGALVVSGARADWCTTDQESVAIDYTAANLGLLNACFTVNTVTLATVDYSCDSGCTTLYYGMMTSLSDCEVTTTGMNWYRSAEELWNACRGSTGTSTLSSGSTDTTSDFSSSDNTETPTTSEETSSATEAPAPTEESTSDVSSSTGSESSSSPTAASGSADASASTTAAPSRSSTGSASGNAAPSLAIGTTVAATAAAIAFIAL